MRRTARLCTLALALAACGDLDLPHAHASAAAIVCAPRLLSRLYFGLDTPTGRVSDADWRRYVDEVVAPRLPDGFTVLAGQGHWRDRDGRLLKEESRVLEVVADDAARVRHALAELVGAYRTRFHQQAVLLTQSRVDACA